MMNSIHKIKGQLIQGIYTKFYYMGQQLCYQIVVNYDKGQILYKDFQNYQDYQTSHQQLVEALNRNKEVDIDFLQLDNNQSSYRAQA